MNDLAPTKPVAIQRAAAYWAGKLRIREAAGRLIEIFKDTAAHRSLRRLAAVSLAYLDGRAAFSDLKAVADNGAEEPEVRIGAQWAVSYMEAAQKTAKPSDGAAVKPAELRVLFADNPENPETLEIQFPADILNPKVKILSIDKSIIL